MEDVLTPDKASRYQRKVQTRIGHHAEDVRFAFDLCYGFFFLAQKQGLCTITPYLRSGETKNAVWVKSTKTGRTWFLSYKHPGIAVHEGVMGGPVRFRFDDTTPVAEISSILNSLLI